MDNLRQFSSILITFDKPGISQALIVAVCLGVLGIASVDYFEWRNELDAQIHSILNQSFSVILGPLEMIPPQAALLLHGYCDNFMAPFKKRVIILTFTFMLKRPLSSAQLDHLWDSTLGTDTSASIVSRVADNVVFIETETGSTPCTDK